MPGITLDPADAAETAETLTLLTEWLSGSHNQAFADSFAAFTGHPAYNAATLCADLHRFAFLLGASDGEEFLIPARWHVPTGPCGTFRQCERKTGRLRRPPPGGVMPWSR